MNLRYFLYATIENTKRPRQNAKSKNNAVIFKQCNIINKSNNGNMRNSLFFFSHIQVERRIGYF